MDGILLAATEVVGKLGESDQQHLVWARELQAMSFVFHIPLVAFGIAFPAIVVFMEGLYLRTGKAHYRALAKRWSKVMITLFAVGVVTGTILSFEFGLLWPNFMATWGDVFGLAFGLEGFSFFIEAIFIAIYVYGWDRIPARTHIMLGIPIIITGITGSLTVIAVNGWMNHPVGFDLSSSGVVSNVRPWEALFNDFFWHELAHMYFAGYMVCGFLVAGVYAFAWLRGQRSAYVRAGMLVPLTVACLASPMQVVLGDWAGRTVAEKQPVKLATFEGLPKTEAGAPFHILGWYEKSTQQVKWAIEIPDLLSILADHDPHGVVQGLDSVPANDRPGPINVVRYAFQTMIGIGTLLAAMGVFYAAVWWRKRRPPRSKWFYRLVVAAGPMALVAMIAGWVTTEVGRQPWVVYQIMRVENAVTDAGGLPIAFFAALAIYLSLAVTVFWLLRRLARNPPEVEVPGPVEAS
ncbi:cytochrome ubiquinol oxidase subunit I [Capillimicrobium parvum]|uniref:Cytochrome bd menaquinol oxidase subunit I n=1 Tax=Capillimicrobium parvum TaxID=2884022 RepID=A0A9E6XZC4_9ACTN|nr:cytochrome ubiquinol oxidase subunit I [Capillimicrobium parvum]UGS36818.1 Putative cytochrome bd menaquinol oxidase subunit I [Capillimicrobium parvum]